MRKIIISILIIGLAVAGYLYRAELKTFIDKKLEKTEEKPAKILRESPPKPVDIYDLSKNTPDLILSKTGQVNSESRVTLTSQISAKVTDIKVKVGDRVSSGQTLISLGDSLASDQIAIQTNTTASALQLQQQLLDLINQSGNYNLISNNLGSQVAQNTYENLQETADSTENLFEIQLESAQEALEEAEETQEDLEEKIDDLNNELDDLEDEYDMLQKNPEQNADRLKQLDSQITQIEAQLEQAEAAERTAENTLEQAELGLEQLEEKNEQQLEQLETSIANSFLQYEMSQTQEGSINIANQIQAISTLLQILQTQSGLETAQLSLSQLNIRAPIDGVISDIQAEKGNFANPGQPLLIIENPSEISIKTTINEKELALLFPTPKITIQTGNEAIPATIVALSPTLTGPQQKFTVELIPLSNYKFIPGESVEIEFHLNNSPLHRFVPLNSIFLENDAKVVKIIDAENRIKNQPVEIGEIIDEFVEIKSGLTGKEKIIENQTIFVDEGEKIIDKDSKKVSQKIPR